MLTTYAQSTKLNGVVIGSSPSIDYTSGSSTTTLNLPSSAFDDDVNTYFASYGGSYTWVGLDLGAKHLISRIGWCPRSVETGPDKMLLGVFEGANRADFMDAVPLYIIDDISAAGQMNYHDVSNTMGFRYVRYVGPSGSHCDVAELAFYGYAADGDNSHLYRPTNLPCIIIHTKDNKEPWSKDTYVESFVTIIGDDGTVLQDTAGLRLRGNASLQFPKKPYRLKFAHKQQVLGSPAKAKNWTLINNYGDKTLMRNIVAFHISEAMGMPYTPFCRAVDLFFNGEYKGCYQLCDKIEVKKGRVDVLKMDTTDIAGEALTGGYLWEMDYQGGYEKSWVRSSRGVWVVLHYPDPDEIVPEQKTYIKQFYQTMEDAAYMASATDTTWRQYIDYPTFSRYFLINQLCGNIDLYWSMYMYKQRNDQKAYAGPVWDFDIAFDNDYRVYPTANQTNYSYGSGGETATMATHILFADAQTKEETAEHWRQARSSGISGNELETFVDSVAAELEQSQRLNFMRWPILSQKVHMNPVALGSYSEEVNRLKEFLTMRVTWMDDKQGYPPTQDITTTTEQTQRTGGYAVYNIQGCLIYSGEIMPDLPQGFYIVQHQQHIYRIIRL